MKLLNACSFKLERMVGSLFDKDLKTYIFKNLKLSVSQEALNRWSSPDLNPLSANLIEALQMSNAKVFVIEAFFVSQTKKDKGRKA